MEIQPFTFNPFQTNCFVCHDAGEAVLIDASCASEEERRVVTRYVAENDLRIVRLLLTHGHIDHIFGCAFFERTYGLSFEMHRDDAPLLSRAEDQARMFGVPLETPPEPTDFLNEDDEVRFGEARFQVLHTPGHSPGSICFFEESARVVVSGDVLFRGSIGRTDLWRGSLPELMQSIFQKLVPLGADVRVFSGHGPETTIGEEQRSNPFLSHGYAQL